MQEFDDRFHVCHFMREEFHHCLVPSHLAEPIDNLEEVRHIFGHRVVSGLRRPPNVMLEVSHYGRHKLVKDGVQHPGLLLIFLDLQQLDASFLQ